MMNKKIEIDQFELRTLMDTHAKALQDLLWEPAADRIIRLVRPSSG